MDQEKILASGWLLRSIDCVHVHCLREKGSTFVVPELLSRLTLAVGPPRELSRYPYQPTKQEQEQDTGGSSGET